MNQKNKFKKQKNYNIICILILLIIIIINSFIVFAAEDNNYALSITIDSLDNPQQILDLSVLEFNDMNEERLVEDHTETLNNIEIQLLQNQDVLYSGKLGGYTSLYNYYPTMNQVKIIFNGKEKMNKKITFCNNNGYCEPCRGLTCELLENEITCNDCRSGTKDYACVGTEDSICDPDCIGTIADPDCSSDCLQYCGIEEEFALTCREYGGFECEPTEDCIRGDMIHAYDVMNCCVRGTCGKINEFVETIAEMESQPLLTITPTGEYASSVISQGIEEQCNDLGGYYCYPDEYCAGEEINFYYGETCCNGLCMTKLELPDIDQQYEEELEGDLSMNEDEVSYMNELFAEDDEEKSIEELLGEDGSDLILIESTEYDDIIASEEGEQNKIVQEEKIIKETKQIPKSFEKQDIIETVMPILIKNKITVSIIGGLVLIFLLIGIIILTHKKSEKIIVKEGVHETHEYNERLNMPIDNSKNLQNQIDMLVTRGYNYNQIKQILLQRQIPLNNVMQEINLNYQKRKK